MTKTVLFCVTWILLIISFQSCTRKYWFRDKVPVESQKFKGTVLVIVENESALLLPTRINETLTNVCYEEWAKKGLNQATKGKADYLFKIQVRVDSQNSSGIALTSNKDQVSYKYSIKNVRSINFSYTFSDARSEKLLLEFDNYLYYYGRSKRDLGRSRQMVKYTVKSIE